MTDALPASNRDVFLVDSDLVGEAWPVVQPAADAAAYGHVTLSPTTAVEVRSLNTFTLTFTVGQFGLDDGGAIRVLFRAIGDGGQLQTSNPTAPNYVTAVASNGVPLRTSAAPGGGARPRRKALNVNVSGGYMSQGDTITITFGDQSGGSVGMKMQTFVEDAFEFKVLTDVCAVGHYIPVPDTPSIAVVPGSPVVWRAVLSSLRRPDEPFIFGFKAEDKWGNPTGLAEGSFTFETTLPVKNLPDRFDYQLGTKAISFEDLRVDVTGELRITVRDELTGEVVARSHPMMIKDGQVSGYWADLHGQSGETIGIGTSRSYFNFARDCAFLDVASHQANDFQVTNEFWAYLNNLTKEFQEDGRFVTFPGYEWSGNTAVGGDRNVFFREEGCEIRRSSHALLIDRSDVDRDATDANQLFEALSDEDCIIFAHVGGRYADINVAHDQKLETALEIHSSWGTFEWLLTDSFDLGYRCGVVGNSDGHKGRPGASYPGSGTFGAIGGLTCYYATELTRDGIFESLKKRHHYGTSGTRMHLAVHADFPTSGLLFDRDPKAYEETTARPVKQVMMGDIVQTDDKKVSITIEVATQSPIERIEIRNGPKLVHTEYGYDEKDLGNRIRVVWCGAEYRGRGRQTPWKGSAKFTNANIKRFEKINAFNHERLLETKGEDTVVFDAITTGNFGGFDVWLEGAENLELMTNRGYVSIPVSQIGLEDTVLEYGGLERKIRIFRLPDENKTYTMNVDVEVDLKPSGDNPIWVCVTTEDGFQAWSSPIYIFNEAN